MTDSQGQHCPNCEAQAAEIDYWKTEARNVRRELKSEQKQTDSAMDNYDAIHRRCEAQAVEIEKLREALAKSEALQDLAYYNGAKQYAAMSAQSENAARNWLAGGCGNRQRDAIAALGETK